mmetsp:Transcript_43628/g.170715  ORF Transcript_43628/g.170715 Transcript_43628/m.170715 type:complete len:345 (-) Transcript_43628:2237-3271(-)
MTEYRPFEESKGVFRSSRSRLRHNPFLLSKSGGDAKVRKRPRDGEQVGNKNSGDQLNRSAPAQKVTSILTLFDQPPVHSDVVYVLVDLVLRQDPSRLKGRNLEIESKLGIIYDKSSGSRVADDIPVCTNSALRSACHQDMRFSSTVNLQSFKTINEMLNRWVIKSPRRSEIECKHVTDVDTSYENGTRETKRVKPADGSRKWVLRKQRLADLNVTCPLSQYDLRYSLSSEEEIAKSGSSRARSRRTKNRQSYRFSNVVIDITAVELEEPLTLEGDKLVSVGVPQNTFEIEVELIYPDGFDLLRECEHIKVRKEQGDIVHTSSLHKLIQELVDTVRGILTAADRR